MRWWSCDSFGGKRGGVVLAGLAHTPTDTMLETSVPRHPVTSTAPQRFPSDSLRTAGPDNKDPEGLIPLRLTMDSAGAMSRGWALDPRREPVW